MKENRKDRLSSLEEALYSRNEGRLPTRERASVSQHILEEQPEQILPEDVSLEEIVSMEHTHPHRKIFEKIFLVSMAFAIIAAGFAGYRFFLGGPSVSEKNISIVIGGPSIISSGGSVSLDLRVENRNARPIEKSVLKIEYPNGARDTGDRTKILKPEEVEVGTLGSGKSFGKQISFVIYGKKDEVETFKTRLEYQVSGSNAIFIKEETFNIVIGTAPIIFNVSIPRTVVSKQPFDALITVKSNSSDTINNVSLSADYPFGFSFKSSEPKPYKDNNIWRLGDIPAGDTKTIKLTGVLEAENNEERTMRFSVSVLGEEKNGSSESQIASSLETIVVSKPFLSLSVHPVGGQTSTEAGDRIQIEINWANNLQVPILNAIVKASVSGVFDQASVMPQNNGFYSSKDQSITWQQSNMGDLASIAPGSTGLVRFNLSIPKILSADARNKGLSIKVLMSGQEEGNSNTQPIQSDAEVSFRFRANPNADAYATRASSPFAQTGPVPPRVNRETTYSVVLSAGSKFADINNGELQAKLPQNVSFNNLVAPGGEKIIYDQNTRELVWEVGNVVAGSPNRAVTLQLTLTPTIGQVGISPLLLTNIYFVGKDALTGEDIFLNLDDVDTRLYRDAGVAENADKVLK